jgi:hypothetical protein
MRHEAAKVSAHDAVPGRALAFVKLSPSICQPEFSSRRQRDDHPQTTARDIRSSKTNRSLDVLGDVLLDSELGHGLLGFSISCVSNALFESIFPPIYLGRQPFTYQLRSSRLAGPRSIGSKRGCQSRKDSGYNRELVGKRFRTISADLTCAVRPNQNPLAFQSSSRVFMTSLPSLQGGFLPSSFSRGAGAGLSGLTLLMVMCAGGNLVASLLADSPTR